MTDKLDPWYEWMIDRATHRKPVDAFFNEALLWTMEWAPNSVPALELGPGPELDLTRHLRRYGHTVFTVDVRPAVPDTVYDKDISRLWPEERRLPFEDGTFKTILAREVFEHVDDLPTMLEECHRLLAPLGRLWFTSVFAFVLHDYEDGDYWRISDKGWRLLLERAGFKRHDVRHERFMYDSWQLPCNVLGWAER